MTEYIEDLFPLYAMDALSDEEKQQVDTYLRENPEAESRLLPFFDSAEMIPFENKPMQPASSVKTALMARVQEDKKPKLTAKPKKSAWRLLWDVLFARTAPAIFAPAVPILLGFLIFGAIRDNTRVRDLNRQIEDQQTAITELQTELDFQRTTIDTQLADLETQQIRLDDQQIVLSVYTAVNAQTIQVESTGVQANAAGKFTYDPDSGRAILDVIALADDPETVYQLWFIQGDTPIPADVFDVNALGSELHVVATALPDSFDAIGITIEPPGGSDLPTGDLVLLGTGS